MNRSNCIVYLIWLYCDINRKSDMQDETRRGCETSIIHGALEENERGMDDNGTRVRENKRKERIV